MASTSTKSEGIVSLAACNEAKSDGVTAESATIVWCSPRITATGASRTALLKRMPICYRQAATREAHLQLFETFLLCSPKRHPKIRSCRTGIADGASVVTVRSRLLWWLAAFWRFWGDPTIHRHSHRAKMGEVRYALDSNKRGKVGGSTNSSLNDEWVLDSGMLCCKRETTLHHTEYHTRYLSLIHI